MTKYLIGVIVLMVLAVPIVYSLTLITLENPFADIDALGTVITPDTSITIPILNTDETITISYEAPAKRRITWRGESRVFSLRKSSVLNGVYGETKFEEGPIHGVYSVGYNETTMTYSSENELEKDVHNDIRLLGGEYRENLKTFVRGKISEKNGQKCLLVIIRKCQSK